MCEDGAAPVRLQVALTLGELGGPAATQGLAAIARRDGEEEWVMTAILTSSKDRAGALLAELLHNSSQPALRPSQRRCDWCESWRRSLATGVI